MKTKLYVILFLFVVFFIITAFAILGNRLENISYDFIKRNLWIAIQIIGIGYIIFEKTQENLIGFFTNLTSTKKVFSDLQEIPSIKDENSFFNDFIISFNGRCYEAPHLNHLVELELLRFCQNNVIIICKTRSTKWEFAFQHGLGHETSSKNAKQGQTRLAPFVFI